MSRTQNQLKKWLYWLKPYRRKGFGVHSPFVFNLVVNVIGARLKNPAFKELASYRKIAVKVLKKAAKEAGSDKLMSKLCHEEIKRLKSSERTDRLLFQLMKYSQAKYPACFGGGIGLSPAYLAMADSRKTIYWLDRKACFEKLSDDLFLNQSDLQNICSAQSNSLKLPPFDFAVFSGTSSMGQLDDFIRNYNRYLTHECFVIVQNIHKNEAMYKFWIQLKKLQKFSVSIDLFHMRILIARAGMQKQDYEFKFRL